MWGRLQDHMGRLRALLIQALGGRSHPPRLACHYCAPDATSTLFFVFELFCFVSEGRVIRRPG